MADQEPAPGLSFPTDPQEFDADDRISFSRLDNKFVGVHDDGSEFEWDAQLKRWIPVMDEELMAQQQLAYGGGGADDDDASNNNANNRSNNKKRKKTAAANNGSERPSKKPRQNTAIYVTGLPLDATVDEVAETFSRKCGVIAEEIDSGRPRVKMYADAQGRFKGDALVVFFKPQSVDMAIMLLDDTDFRFSASGLSSGRMRVQAADASYKKTSYEPKPGEGEADGATADGEQQEPRRGEEPGSHITGTAKPRDRAREQDKQKVIRRTQKLDAKLADWDDEDEGGAAAGPSSYGSGSGGGQPAQGGRVVVLRHMFTLAELDADPAALLDIKEDIRDECGKLGAVTNVVLFDLEPDGVASVRFADPAAARACADALDGRAFDGRTVRATLAQGRERFRRSDKRQGGDDQEEEEEDGAIDGDGGKGSVRGKKEGEENPPPAERNKNGQDGAPATAGKR
ncbi:hypothetical protein GGR56DRAFT_206714 [Xylariaceae sp. FL0804]|nr:hypothetical protein GGR56DRAFT_206714 [Xylariaceae sp. FL0804]